MSAPVPSCSPEMATALSECRDFIADLKGGAKFEGRAIEHANELIENADAALTGEAAEAPDPLEGLVERLDRLCLTSTEDGRRFLLATESARNIVGIVREWLRTRGAAQAAVGCGDRAGIEWFERTFRVPLGDMPGSHAVEEARARAAKEPQTLAPVQAASNFTPGDPVEVRLQNEAIDEIVIRRGDVHIEQMSGDNWFMGVNASDGSYWQFWLGAKNRKSHVEVRHVETISAAENARAALSSTGTETPALTNRGGVE